jgi:hypothetical protein
VVDPEGSSDYHACRNSSRSLQKQFGQGRPKGKKVSLARMRQSDPSDVPADNSTSPNADFLGKVFRTTEPITPPARPEEGWRLVRTFLSIRSPKRREAVLKYVVDVARTDEAESTH